MDNSRRSFIKKATTSGAAILAAPAVFGMEGPRKKEKAADPVAPFKLKYAPYIGMFKEHAGEGIIDNIKFCYDMGFRAMFDNGLMGRPVEDQVGQPGSPPAMERMASGPGTPLTFRRRPIHRRCSPLSSILEPWNLLSSDPVLNFRLQTSQCAFKDSLSEALGLVAEHPRARSIPQAPKGTKARLARHRASA